MNTERIIDELSTLRLLELEQVDMAIHELIDHIRATQRPEYEAEQRQGQRKSYQQEMVKCGKESCQKCQQGPGHGPYWYAYWSESGRTRKKYVGKHLREV